MKIVSIFKAQPTVDPIEPVTILFSDDVPEIKELKDYRPFYIDQGKRLAEALCTTLPGGTLDQLLCELLTRRASLFRVPMFDKKEE